MGVTKHPDLGLKNGSLQIKENTSRHTKKTVSENFWSPLTRFFQHF